MEINHFSSLELELYSSNSIFLTSVKVTDVQSNIRTFDKIGTSFY